ncbi:MAG: ribonuclease H family protein [Methanomassiliicoccales archaeon]
MGKIKDISEQVVHYDLVCDGSKNELGSGRVRKAAGLGYVIKQEGKEDKAFSIDGRAVTSCQAELKAILSGLKRIVDYAPINKTVTVMCDSITVINFLNGDFTSHREYNSKVINKIRDLETKFMSIDYVHCDAKTARRADRRSKSGKKDAEMKIESKIKIKKENFFVMLEKSEDVKIISDESQYFAIASNGIDKYSVSIDPLSCECKYWVEKYSNLPSQGIIRSRCVPCKHMFALASITGQLEELMKLAEK